MHAKLCRICLIALVGLAGPVVRAQREKLPPDDVELVEKTWPDALRTGTGIRYVVLAEGKGEPPQPGDKVALLYEGRLLRGEVFDKAMDRQHPFVFRVGRERVIPGMDQIVLLMRPGERRLVIIPPELGYGTRGVPQRIPRNATLVFQFELLEIKHD